MSKLDLTKPRMKKEEIDHEYHFVDFNGEIDDVIAVLNDLKTEFRGYQEIFIEFVPENTHFDIFTYLTGFREETEAEVLARVNVVKDRLFDKVSDPVEKEELKELRRLMVKFKDRI